MSLAFVYCDWRLGKIQSTIALIASLLRQFLETHWQVKKSVCQPANMNLASYFKLGPSSTQVVSPIIQINSSAAVASQFIWLILIVYLGT